MHDIIKLSYLVYFVFLMGCSGNQTENLYVDQVPEGMVYVKGGKTAIGSDDGQPNEQPVFETEISPFYMDKNLVTVADFRKFVGETNYTTEAEVLGNGLVFDFDRAEWILVEGVSWEYPNGVNFEKAQDNHPVRQVSWNDANAYLEWSGKRLPSEIEWEHAAKAGRNIDLPYSWGTSLIEQGRYRANTWTGVFPIENTAEDGYLQTSPVGEFNVTELGLTDMGGNVWEWTQDWYRSYSERDVPFQPTKLSEKVLRGGSFMCHISYCHGYRVSARSHTTPDNALFHVGFRGVKDIKLEAD